MQLETDSIDLSPNIASTNDSSASSYTVQNTSRLERFLQQSITPVHRCDASTMAHRLKKFAFQEKLGTDIVHWWEEHKSSDDDNLYSLACVALAVPCTQVSVERAFSAFGQVLTAFRTRLQKTRMEMILFIKLNSELFHTHDIDIINEDATQK